MNELYTIKDFLIKTKECLNCKSPMNLYINILKNGTIIEKDNTAEFDISGDILKIFIKRKFDEKKASIIKIDIKLHNYHYYNISNTTISLSRSCGKCKKYNVYTKPLDFKKLLRPIGIFYIEAFIRNNRKEYIITQSEEFSKVSISPAGVTCTFPINILSLSREDIIKKIEKYEILY